jgi:hypothetical protein
MLHQTHVPCSDSQTRAADYTPHTQRMEHALLSLSGRSSRFVNVILARIDDNLPDEAKLDSAYSSLL